ncbi:RNA polymerase sigma factor [Aureitalea marina]|uniref:RNA polymerase subunit sigma-70 n=1 Tax=Aureitalea marina TaxID=930804 RepID=A0A2S7KQR0_9FLAO|nr:RNA polymerase sigma factor [Aureitalea marina]PQB04903.1 RNA polymerase subunit sigma-70 [Aureitalea marina]
MEKKLFENVCQEQIYSQLYQRLAKDLHDFIYFKYGNQVNPEDKVHEAFMKLWQNCDSVPPEKAKSYLFTVANNLVLNELKHNKVVYKFKQIPKRSETNKTPHTELVEEEYLERFQEALNKLPEGQRIAFLLNRVEGKKHQEIADMLDISRKAVEKRIYTALDKILKELGEILE